MAAAQGAQACAPVIAVTLPAAQATQEERELCPGAGFARPAGHWMQPEEVCPVVGLYVPAVHAAQSSEEAAPAVLRKVPAGQLMQADALYASA